jgi:phage/plasmid primase-like uncharacterized protein
VRVPLLRSESVPNDAALDFAKLADEFRRAIRPEALGQLAAELRLSTDSLIRLGIGYWVARRAWTFPMLDAAGNVLGIRLRLADGKKLSVRGGNEGVFIPNDLELAGGQLLIAEGPTDTAALLDMGFQAAGRPSCSGGVKSMVELVSKLAVPEVVIVADGDEPGQRGAENLATALLAYATAVRIIIPPAGIKDARAWKLSGAAMADVQAVIDATPTRRLKICVKGRKP